jgi:hypothetical protein
MTVATKGTPFAIYATSTSGKMTTSTNTPVQYKEFQDVFEKNMRTSCSSIDRTIVPLIFKMKLNHHLVQSTIYHRMSSRH